MQNVCCVSELWLSKWVHLCVSRHSSGVFYLALHRDLNTTLDVYVIGDGLLKLCTGIYHYLY